MLILSQLVVLGCGDNAPSTKTDAAQGTGGKTGSGGGVDAAQGTGGAAGAGGVSGSGGSVDGGVGDDGGSGSGGATGSGGSNSQYSPLCGSLTTAAGPAPTKGGACTASDPQLCYKTCGPTSIGFKTETCNGSAYDEGACVFPPELNYACFKIPATIDSTCPTAIPRSGQPCTVAECVVCNVGGQYYDSTGTTPKDGYCVCTATGKWSCGSTTAWPCPSGQGC